MKGSGVLIEKKRKINGSRAKPWATPYFINLWFELKSLIETYWVWLHE